MDDDSVDDILRSSFYIVQNRPWSIVSNVCEQVTLDVQHKHVVGEKLNAFIAKLFDTNAAAKWFYKSFVTSNLVMVPIAIFLRIEGMQKWKNGSTVLPMPERSWRAQYRRFTTISNRHWALPTAWMKNCLVRCTFKRRLKASQQAENKDVVWHSLLKNSWRAGTTLAWVRSTRGTDNRRTNNTFITVEPKTSERTMIRRMTARKNIYAFSMRRFL